MTTLAPSALLGPAQRRGGPDEVAGRQIPEATAEVSKVNVARYDIIIDVIIGISQSPSLTAPNR